VTVPKCEVEFFLGTHRPHWLTDSDVPLFVSDATLRDYKTLPKARTRWVPDSGGFTELQRHGRWTVPPAEYVARIRRYVDEIGHVAWAAPQDWMCEKPIIYGGKFGPNTFAGTRQFVDPNHTMSHDEIIYEHQRRTILNVLTLRGIDPTLPFIEVVQGDKPWHYLQHVDMYLDLAGIDLTQSPLVGVGSVCRRQATDEAGEILTALHDRGLTRKHAFGFKIEGMRRFGHLLTSADSLAWPYRAMKHGQAAARLGLPHGLMWTCSPGPHHPAKNCANCRTFAMAWRRQVMANAGSRPRPLQGALFDV
jgi:hypothetical protein